MLLRLLTYGAIAYFLWFAFLGAASTLYSAVMVGSRIIYLALPVPTGETAEDIEKQRKKWREDIPKYCILFFLSFIVGLIHWFGYIFVKRYL